jgi:asparagine synthase (glutamine-hydrolysing)
MCGIVGIRRFDGGTVHESDLRTMAAQLAHRGPDGEGYWTDGPVGFGHRRLSIIDVAGSAQPMASAGDRLHVTFNGEIFNYKELRRRLRYPYRTNGDTEVLLAAFAERGPAGVQQLQGQFAYSIYDGDAATLWLFRDRLGVLPLYYYADADVLLFASEIKALLPMLPAPPEVDEASLFSYLGAASVPAPHTMFRGIRKLPQGHWLRVGPDGWVTTHRYWEVPADGEVLDVTDGEAVDLVESALQRSVEAALVADVPVGAYLSGGLDSSLIVALMDKAAGSTIDTFSAGFGDPRFDELPHARRVSDLFGTHHTEVVVTPDDFQRLWPELTWNRDAPLSQPADVALHLLAGVARERVKVVLSGEGSDELFGGYPKHRVARWGAAAGRSPAGVRTPMLGAAQRRLPARANRLRIAARALGEAGEQERIAGWFAPFTTTERRRLLGDTAVHAAPALWAAGGGDPLRRMLSADCHQWLADNLLERGDRMSMSASLELRPPFLDHRLVELAFSLPSSVKVRRGSGKWVVKEVARRHLPTSIVDRPKVGFRVPLDAWLRGALRPMASDLLCAPGSFVGQVMDRSAVRSLLDSHDRGRTNEEMRIWALLSLEVWHSRYFGADRSVPAVAR